MSNLINQGRVKKCCIGPKHKLQLTSLVVGNTWKVPNFPLYPDDEFLSKIGCRNVTETGAVQTVAALRDDYDIDIYHNCEFTTYAALRRQVKSTIRADPVLCERIFDFFKSHLMPEIIDLLGDFQYSYTIWYNHLTASQQRELDVLDISYVKMRFARMFCKSEKQLRWLGDAMSKSRAISAMNVYHKHVIGPVIYALEQLFKNWFSYCGGKSWSDLTVIYDKHFNLDHKLIVQTDVSAMDLSVQKPLMDIVNYFYNYVKQFVTHVTQDEWLFHTVEVVYTKIYGKYFTREGIASIGFAEVLYTVFSGENSTTFKNTFLSGIVFRFLYEYKLHLTKADYMLACKGDDSLAMLPDTFDINKLLAAMHEIYPFAILGNNEYAPFFQHGCGLTIKYCQLAHDTNSINLCSTNTFYCKTCKHHRIVRQLDRFITLIPWSEKMKDLPKNKYRAYCTALYKANLRWCKGLSIFSWINDDLNYDDNTNYIIDSSVRRKTLPLAEWEKKLLRTVYKHDESQQTQFLKLCQQFGHNLAYTLSLQEQNLQNCCIGAFDEWLYTYYNLTQIDLQQIKHDFKHKRYVYKGTTYYDSPTLVDGLAYYKKYIKSQCFD